MIQLDTEALEAPLEWVTAHDLFASVPVTKPTGYRVIRKLRNAGYEITPRKRLPNLKTVYYDPALTALIRSWALTYNRKG